MLYMCNHKCWIPHCMQFLEKKERKKERKTKTS